MLRKLLCAALLAMPATAQAQVSYQFTDVVTNANGFTATLLFRNINSYSDPAPVFIGGVFYVGTSQKVVSLCAAAAVCEIGGMAHTVGPVQTGDFTQGGGTWSSHGASLGFNGCMMVKCTQHAFFSDNSVPFLGCQVPSGAGGGYAARFCDADGYTGSLALDLIFTYSYGREANPDVVFDASDLNVQFSTRTVVPEPATLALLAVGLGVLGVLDVLGVVARKQRHSR